MNEVLADTSGLANFFVRTEPFHNRAKALIRRWQIGGVRVVTTNYVLTELVAVLTSPMRIARPVQISYIDIVQAATWVVILHVDAALDAGAWKLLKARLDKEWSLVDYVSFVVMQQRGITEALTTDHHFEQAGFVRLLR
jgi:predicted nucleic acid-binding protein